LGISQQLVNYRWGVIRANYPELLQKNYKTPTKDLQKKNKKTKELPNDDKKEDNENFCGEDNKEITKELPNDYKKTKEIQIKNKTLTNEEWKKQFSF
jgi:hypothetical protein